MYGKASIKYLNILTAILITACIAWFKFEYHELWKDEWQAWFVAKDKSIADVFSFLYYEGHPALWYLYLKIFALFSNGNNDFILLNIAHLITVVSGLYFLFVKFRMPLVIKLILAASYFMFFEYGIVNRGYYLVILFAFWAVWLLSKNNYKPLHLAIVLFLLCQTEVYGTLMAGALGFYILYNNYERREKLFSMPVFGLLAGLIIFVVSVFPRDTGHITRTSPGSWSLGDKLLIAVQGNLANTYTPGLTKDTFTYGSTAAGLLLSLMIAIVLYFIFRKDRKVLVTMGLFLLSVIMFSFLIFTGGIRQWGMGFVFFIAMLQLTNTEWSKERGIIVAIALLSIFNIIHGFKALKEDYTYPFSNAMETGNFIKAKVPEKVPVVALNKFDATPVIGYAGRKFYELPDGKPFSYFRWVDRIYVPTEGELQLFGKFKGVGGVILLSPKPIDSQRYPSATLWKKFDGTNYKNENYYIYTLPVQ